jgi:putative transposase
MVYNIYTMYLTETHIIKGTKELDNFTFKCKNLYNKANYIIRMEFIENGRYIQKFDMFTILKDDNDYKSLPARVSRGVLRTLDGNWRGFFTTIKDWKSNPGKYLRKPNLPKYLPKSGKFNAIFTDTGILKPKNGKIGLSGLSQRIKSKINYEHIKEVNIKPLPSGKYKINVIYKYNEKKKLENNKKYCSIDLGLNNLMTLTSNSGLNPTLVNGRPLKSINQYYNKMLAKYKSQLPKGVKTSKKIQKLTEKRENKINDYIHKSTRYVVDYCLENELNTLVLGYNEGWKSGVEMGKRNNQNFVGIPYEILKWYLNYKTIMSGINLITQEESYTSKCSAIDLEPIKKQDIYMGSRIKRGLFKTSGGNIVNADVNGSLNILRKAVPNIQWINGIEDCAVNPKRVKSFK